MDDAPQVNQGQRRRTSAGSPRIMASLSASPAFRRLWFSNIFFFGGVWTQTLVLGWLVYDTTGSKFLLALFTAARFGPLLLGPVGGILSDRFNRVRILTVAGLWAMSAVLVVAGLVWSGHAPFWALVAGGFAIGLAQSPSQPSRSSLVLDLVGRGRLSNANALNLIAMNLPQIFGPAMGGAMIDLFGAPAALSISAVWYGLSVVALRPLRSLAQTRYGHPDSPVESISGGFRRVLANRLTAAVLFVTLAANFFIWPIYQGFIPIFAKDVLSIDAAGLGWLLTCGGIGGFIGALIIGSLGDFTYKGALFVLGTCAWGVLWAAFALSQSPPISFLLMGAIGLLSAPFGVMQTTLMLMTTEPKLQGRALGMQELTIGIMPFSTLALGVLAQEFGVATTTFISGSLLALLMVGLALRVPELIRYSGVEHG